MRKRRAAASLSRRVVERSVLAAACCRPTLSWSDASAWTAFRDDTDRRFRDDRVVSPRHRARFSFARGRQVIPASSLFANPGDQEKEGGEGLYGPFASHAWSRLVTEGFVEIDDGSSPPLVPPELALRDVPAKGRANDGRRVRVEVRAARGASGLRYARYAALRTVDANGDDVVGAGTGALHVLNLVLFPSTAAAYATVPIFGADLVSLPGDRHLVAIDAQPFLLPSSSSPLPDNDDLRARLDALRERVAEDDDLPWGGDVPEKARRFFSDGALWTRLGGPNNNDDDHVDPLTIIRSKVYDRFVEYLDLYLDVLRAAEAAAAADDDDGSVTTSEREIVEGQTAYLDYRRENDPARPMLRGLYGEEWTERLINEVLFQPIITDT